MNEIRLLKTDGSALTLPPEGGEAGGFRVTRTVSADGLHTLTLTPLTGGLCLDALEYEFDLPASLLTPADQLYYYDNGAHTNDTTDVHPYVGNEKRLIAEMAVFKNKAAGEVLLVGLLTAQRFWADGHLIDGTYTLRFELEGRTLNAGEDHVLERFLIAGGVNNEYELLERYGDLVGQLNGAVPTGDLPTGWCSWSCFYDNVDEEKIRRAADAQAVYAAGRDPGVIQIDDGWQTNGSFCGEWVADPKKFPSGLPALAAYVNERGMTFGLWLAPVLLSDKSEYYEQCRDISLPIATLGEHFHPFDLGNPRFHEHLRKTFRRMVDEYGARYFKLDFLAASVRDFNGRVKFAKFKDGFCIECLRSALKVIRDTVGPDVLLLSCGAQTLVGAGILNAARTSCDIIQSKNLSFPDYWTLIRMCTETVSRRYFLHRRVFINDPDGVVLRDVDVGDGFNATYSEARLWAISAAMSGGSVLSNDELEKLSPARRVLYTQLLPALDLPGRPVDYFEYPHPTATWIPVDENTAFLALYHWGDERSAGMTFDLSRIGMKGACAVDCLTHEVLGFVDEVKTGILQPHDAAMYLLRRPGSQPSFAWSDFNVFGGVNLYESAWRDGALTVRPTSDTFTDTAALYAFFPAGFEPEGEVILHTDACTVTRVRPSEE